MRMSEEKRGCEGQPRFCIFCFQIGGSIQGGNKKGQNRQGMAPARSFTQSHEKRCGQGRKPSIVSAYMADASYHTVQVASAITLSLRRECDEKTFFFAIDQRGMQTLCTFVCLPDFDL